MVALGGERLVLGVKYAASAGTVVGNFAFQKADARRERELQAAIRQLQPAGARINNPTDQVGYDLVRECCGIVAMQEGGVAAPGRTVAAMIHIGFEEQELCQRRLV